MLSGPAVAYPKHWPEDVGRYWVEAKRCIEAKTWTAAALMARSAVQLVARKNDAKGNNLKQEIDDLAAKGLILPIMKEWAHEVRELANEGTHPQPDSEGDRQEGCERRGGVSRLPDDRDAQFAKAN
jgi:hypothetical protein